MHPRSGPVTLNDLTLAIASVARPQELAATLAQVRDLANVQVVLDGADRAAYAPVVAAYPTVRFTWNPVSQGVAAVWNQGIVQAPTRYVIVSSDHLFFSPGWAESLLSYLNSPQPAPHISLSLPMSFACFCLDKALIGRIGWFDHNFTRAYFEDEDWYLRLQEPLGYTTDALAHRTLIPLLATVARPPKKFAPRTLWNPVPNRFYFGLKWVRRRNPGPRTVYGRGNTPYRRRFAEPTWPHLEPIRARYRDGDYGAAPWRYDRPWRSLRLLTALSGQIYRLLARG
jgi:hypothetical protein